MASCSLHGFSILTSSEIHSLTPRAYPRRPSSFHRFHAQFPRSRRPIRATAAMEVDQTGSSAAGSASSPPMKLLFVEMGVGYDQHGQDITAAAIRACRDAIPSNSIPAFRRGSIPGVSFGQMKLQIKLGVPHSLQKSLDTESGEILDVEVVDGGLICSSGVLVEEMGDKNEDCYIVNAAVYVGSWVLVIIFCKTIEAWEDSWQKYQSAFQLLQIASHYLMHE